MSGVVERLHALLVNAVSERRGGDPAAAPVTVAEIYQELVPYRGVRAALGLEMNADYEHVLLRLLSGESELARLEPPTAREQLRDELGSPNPNVTLYRKFAGCDVWLAAPVTSTDWVTSQLLDDDPQLEWAAPDTPPDALGWSVEDIENMELPLEEMSEADDVEAPGPGPEAPRPADAGQPVSAAPPAPAAAPGAAAPSAGTTAGAPPRPASAGQGAPCVFCDSALPRGRAIRFCPYCGADQTQRPCAACGEVLEAGWTFCIACGASADASA